MINGHHFFAGGRWHNQHYNCIKNKIYDSVKTYLPGEHAPFTPPPPDPTVQSKSNIIAIFMQWKVIKQTIILKTEN